MNKTEEKVLTYLQKHFPIDSGMNICVCFSGGVDSSVLLNVLYSIRNSIGFSVSACHFNHMIRGIEADNDASFCRKVCKTLGIPFYYGHANIPKLAESSNLSLEECARNARYSWFDSIAKEHHIDLFATAHHKNDQAETLIFRLVRGTSVSGLSGIPIQRDHYIRPLLCLSKDEINTYAEEQKLNFCIDSSNECDLYTRNYIRHTVIPQLQKINPSVTDAICRLAQYAKDDETFFSSMLPDYREVQNLTGLHKAIVKRVVGRNFMIYSGKSLCYTHTDEICNAVISLRDTKISLPSGFYAIVSNGCLSFEKENNTQKVFIEKTALQTGVTLLHNGAVRVSYYPVDGLENNRIESVETQFVYNLSTEFYLSSQTICGMIYYKSRCPGDRMVLHGINRSVKKLISEQKIPLYLRDLLPIMCDDSGILGIPFVAVSDRLFCSKQKANYYLRVEIAEEQARKVVEVQ